MTKRAPAPTWFLICMLLAASISLAACDEMAVSEQDGITIESQEYAYKHATPPGAPPWDYYLTSYGAPGDHAYNKTPGCGGKVVDANWYYSTGAYTFGCGAKLKLQANGKCVVVSVVDNGPAEWVEQKAQAKCGGTGYIIDASPLVAEHLFSAKSAGWSECRQIKVSQVPPSTPEGPCYGGGESGYEPQPQPPEYQQPWEQPNPYGGSSNFIGDSCSHGGECKSKKCVTEYQHNFPSGMCTLRCGEGGHAGMYGDSRLCPDMPGKATTFCAKVRGPAGPMGLCFSRCGYGGAPACRPGYVCSPHGFPRFNQEQISHRICVPAWAMGKADGSNLAIDTPPDDASAPAYGCSMSAGSDSGTGLQAFLLLLIAFGFCLCIRTRSRNRG